MSLITYDIVVSHYKENINWIDQLDTNKYNLHIYHKNDNLIDYDKKILPNIGRESYTYARYIIENYESLKSNTVNNIIFLQGFPFDHLGSLSHLFKDIFKTHEEYQKYACYAMRNNDSLISSTYSTQHIELINFFIEYLNNNNLISRNTQDFIYIGTKHSDNGFIKEKLSILEYLSIRTYEQYFPIGAQFLINKNMIINKDFRWWKSFYQMHHNNIPVCKQTIPYVTERLWPYIFKHTL